MEFRCVLIDLSEINTFVFSSVLNIGDVVQLSPKSKAIAVQRETNVWNDDYDQEFKDYSIFKLPANWIDIEIPVKSHTFHHAGNIHVPTVNVNAVSQSSTVQYGGVKFINAEARLKHIRILRD